MGVPDRVLGWPTEHCPPADAKQPAAFFQGTILKVNEAYAKANKGSKFEGMAVITRGPRSPWIYDWKNENSLMPFCNDSNGQCVNHVGAGDCFGAHLVLCLAHGLKMLDACRRMVRQALF